MKSQHKITDESIVHSVHTGGWELEDPTLSDHQIQHLIDLLDVKLSHDEKARFRNGINITYNSYKKQKDTLTKVPPIIEHRLKEKDIPTKPSTRLKREQEEVIKISEEILELTALLNKMSIPLQDEFRHHLFFRSQAAKVDTPRFSEEIDKIIQSAGLILGTVQSLNIETKRSSSSQIEQEAIDNLIQLYVHFTKKEPTRTYNPVSETETFPFQDFAQQALAYMSNDPDINCSSLIRKQASAYKKRRKTKP